jgi:site-specific DNA recombinase
MPSEVNPSTVRAALYARVSSDLQSAASIDDQLRVCAEWAANQGLSVTGSYTDQGISGASLIRPGIQKLLQDAAAGKCTVILTESLDRLSRDQEDIAHIYKRMRFLGVKIVTLSEGEVNELHIGLKGTMGALYLKDLADKTRRGLRGRIEAGKSAGGNSYGYDVIKKIDDNGEPVRGERRINPQQAAIVTRVSSATTPGASRHAPSPSSSTRKACAARPARPGARARSTAIGSAAPASSTTSSTSANGSGTGCGSSRTRRPASGSPG